MGQKQNVLSSTYYYDSTSIYLEHFWVGREAHNCLTDLVAYAKCETELIMANEEAKTKPLVLWFPILIRKSFYPENVV